MATTYVPTAIATSPRDQVRFWVRDTGTGGVWVYTDEEIDGLLVLYGRPCAVAVMLLRQRAADLAKDSGGSRSIGDLSITGGGAEAGTQYAAMADKLEVWCRRNGAGAITAQFAPPGQDGRPALFTIGMMDHPEDGDPFPFDSEIGTV